MISFKVDENGDLIVNNRGDLVTVEGKDEEQQCVERCLTTGQGEWFLNILHGLDYSELLGKNVDEEVGRIAILEAINQEPRVEDVEEITREFDRMRRIAVWKIKVRMQSGNIVEAVIDIE